MKREKKMDLQRGKWENITFKSAAPEVYQTPSATSQTLVIGGQRRER